MYRNDPQISPIMCDDPPPPPKKNPHTPKNIYLKPPISIEFWNPILNFNIFLDFQTNEYF